MNQVLQLSNIVAFLLVITFNALANALPIAGRTTGELSDLYPNLFVPAGLTFSIWGVIYLGLLGFIIIQARGVFSSEKEAPAYVSKIGWLFVLNGLLNAAWIVIWHNQLIILSLFIMLGILITLILIYERIEPARRQDASTLERIFLYLPFSIYLGWICIATIANFTTLLVDLNWNGGAIGAVNWTIAVILIGTLIQAFYALKRNDSILPLVGVWAFMGIILKRTDAEPVYISIIISAGVCASILFLLSAYRIIRR